LTWFDKVFVEGYSSTKMPTPEISTPEAGGALFNELPSVFFLNEILELTGSRQSWKGEIILNGKPIHAELKLDSSSAAISIALRDHNDHVRESWVIDQRWHNALKIAVTIISQHNSISPEINNRKTYQDTVELYWATFADWSERIIGVDDIDFIKSRVGFPNDLFESPRDVATALAKITAAVREAATTKSHLPEISSHLTSGNSE